jgi:hypothetical protein
MPPRPDRHVRQWLGAALREWPHYRRVLARNDDGYLALCNRGQRLEPSPEGPGFRCDWQWTSDLHAPRMLPHLGRRLMQRALDDHPVRLADEPERTAGAPDIAFVIGHRGEARADHLLATLRSIAGQQGTQVECVVVEQDVQPRMRTRLPAWVRHVHAPPPTADMPYCRSWAFNVGVRECRAPLVVLHDNDMLVPADYARQARGLAARGYEAMNLKRFVFYLSQAHTARLLAGAAGFTDEAPLAITQNLEAGGSAVITRDAFERIGGMDEAFIGWGGEDNEFWQRCQALKVWPWGRLPIVHCWHEAQPQKGRADRDTEALLRQRSTVAVAERIARLRQRPSGLLAGPQGAA